MSFQNSGMFQRREPKSGWWWSCWMMYNMATLEYTPFCLGFSQETLSPSPQISTSVWHCLVSMAAPVET